MFNKILMGSNQVQLYGTSVGGYLFNWGTADNNNIQWLQSTNYGIGWYGHYPILYSHGQNKDMGVEKIGTIYVVKATNDGLLIGGFLDPENEWYEAICALQEKKSLIWSAAPAQHLCRSEGDVWVTYPIVEFSVKLIDNSLDI